MNPTRIALRLGLVAATLLLTLTPSVSAGTIIHIGRPVLALDVIDVAPPSFFNVDCRFHTPTNPATSAPLPPGSYLAVVVAGSCQYRTFNCAQDTIWVKIDCGIPPPTTLPPCDLVIDGSCIPGEGVFQHNGPTNPALWAPVRAHYVDTTYTDNSGTLTIALYKL